MSDQNRSLFKYESGAYANALTDGQWIGMVQSSEINENINVQQTRYIGTSTRDVGRQIETTKDVDISFEYYPQDFKFLVFAMGSCADGGSSSPYSHDIIAVDSDDVNAFTSGTTNPFLSFTYCDEQGAPNVNDNFKREVNGCVVDELSISASQEDFVSVSVSAIGKDVISSSGSLTSVTESTLTPYLFHDCTVDIESGNTLNGLTDFTFTIRNNTEGKHYGDGSDTISIARPNTREYELSLTLDSTTENRDDLYNKYYKGGSEFNTLLHIGKRTGSQDAYIFMSGCRITEMSDPSELEGNNTEELTIIPTTANALVNDTVELYNAW
jgi:hypothetical protein